ncbi:MAG: ABC transporter substrate-binding protein [Rhodospirillales bacterium]|nr:ABC transporter substrate-binding protein [Rhodospirillales bacterium]
MRSLLMLMAVSLLAAAPARAGELTLYTSQPNKIAAETVAAFEKADPGVHVSVFRSGTTQVMNKLGAEFMAGRPKADVLLIADAMSMQALKQQGRLLPDPGQDVTGFAPGTYDPGRTYFGTKLITTGIVYNKAAPFVPHSWKDLLRAKARGQVVLPSPLYSGAAMITMGAFTENPAIGADYFKKLAAERAISVAGNGGVLNQVQSGSRAFGIVVDFMALNAKAKGAPVGFVFPREGVTAVTEPVAILKTTRNAKDARAFVAFLLSPAGQRLAARQGFIPARQGIAPPPGFPSAGPIHLMTMDIGRILKDSTRLKQQFSDLFGG